MSVWWSGMQQGYQNVSSVIRMWIIPGRKETILLQFDVQIWVQLFQLNCGWLLKAKILSLIKRPVGFSVSLVYSSSVFTCSWPWSRCRCWVAHHPFSPLTPGALLERASNLSLSHPLPPPPSTDIHYSCLHFNPVHVLRSYILTAKLLQHYIRI